jgi:hypothetical protein
MVPVINHAIWIGGRGSLLVSGKPTYPPLRRVPMIISRLVLLLLASLASQPYRYRP